MSYHPHLLPESSSIIIWRSYFVYCAHFYWRALVDVATLTYVYGLLGWLNALLKASVDRLCGRNLRLLMVCSSSLKFWNQLADCFELETVDMKARWCDDERLRCIIYCRFKMFCIRNCNHPIPIHWKVLFLCNRKDLCHIYKHNEWI